MVPAAAGKTVKQMVATVALGPAMGPGVPPKATTPGAKLRFAKNEPVVQAAPCVPLRTASLLLSYRSDKSTAPTDNAPEFTRTARHTAPDGPMEFSGNPAALPKSISPTSGSRLAANVLVTTTDVFTTPVMVSVSNAG